MHATPSLVLLFLLGAAAQVSGQQVWVQATPATSPPAFGGSQAMAFDSVRGKSLLIGNGPTGTKTWEWDGSSWLQAPLAANPPATLEYSLGFDPARRRVVFAGAQQTWEWDPVGSSSWIKNPVSSSRGPRAPFLYHSGRGKLMTVWGGNNIVAETWDGQQWSAILATTQPTGRNYYWAAYDSDRQRLVMFGGVNGIFLFSDTWEWDGTDWRARYPAHVPPGRYGHSMVYDPDRKRIVMFGGFNATELDDLWEWDGNDWQQVTLSPRPSARYLHTAVYDTARRRMVLFGGFSGFVPVADTWEYFLEVAPSYSAFGLGCAGSAGTPRLLAAIGSLPRLGASFSVDLTQLRPGMATILTLGTSKTLLGQLPLPFDLTMIGMPGCWAYTSMDATFALTNLSGAARWTATIPNVLSLAGQSFYNQAFVADPGVNILGVVASNAGEGKVGT